MLLYSFVFFARNYLFKFFFLEIEYEMYQSLHGCHTPSILIKLIPNVMFDSQDNPEKTAATIRGNFYVTGDRGVMDSDGYFWFVGRADDVIISSGYVHLVLLESHNLPGKSTQVQISKASSFPLLGTVLGHLKWRVH